VFVVLAKCQILPPIDRRRNLLSIPQPCLLLASHSESGVLHLMSSDVAVSTGQSKTLTLHSPPQQLHSLVNPVVNALHLNAYQHSYVKKRKWLAYSSQPVCLPLIELCRRFVSQLLKSVLVFLVKPGKPCFSTPHTSKISQRLTIQCRPESSSLRKPLRPWIT